MPHVHAFARTLWQSTPVPHTYHIRHACLCVHMPHRFQRLGTAASLCHHYSLQYSPRQQLQVSQLSAALLPAPHQLLLKLPPPLPYTEFDFVGVVVGMSAVHAHSGPGGGGHWQQWVFLADHTSGLCAHSAAAAAAANANLQQQPWLLALHLKGQAVR